MAQSHLPVFRVEGLPKWRSGIQQSPLFIGGGLFLFRMRGTTHNLMPGRQGGKMIRKIGFLVTLLMMATLTASCSPRIYGRLDLVDAGMRPVATDNAQGTVVNMMNTTAPLEKASHAATVDAKGEFTSAKDAIVRGMYKVEASRIGYVTETQTVEIGRFTRKKVEFKLKKIDEGKRKAIEGATSDEDKIINPGEVNLQPPSM